MSKNESRKLADASAKPEPCAALGGSTVKMEGKMLAIHAPNQNPFKNLGGSQTHEFNTVMLRQTVATVSGQATSLSAIVSCKKNAGTNSI